MNARHDGQAWRAQCRDDAAWRAEAKRKLAPAPAPHLTPRAAKALAKIRHKRAKLAH